MKKIQILQNVIYYKIYSCLINNNIKYIKVLEDFIHIFNKNIKIIKDNFGKPFIYNINLNMLYPISISHSKEKMIMAVSKNPKILMGIDIELKKVSDEVINRIISIDEKKYIQKSKLSNSDVWMQKEAISKAIGSGLSMGLKNIDISKKKLFDFEILNEKIIDDDIVFYVTILQK